MMVYKVNYFDLCPGNKRKLSTIKCSKKINKLHATNQHCRVVVHALDASELGCLAAVVGVLIHTKV